MAFDSLTFLFIYLPAAVILYYIIPGRFRNIFLTAAGIFYVGWNDLTSLLILLFLILNNFIFTNHIYASLKKDREKAKRLLLACLIIDILPLLVFRYFGVFAGWLHDIGLDYIRYPQLHVPFGITFYTLILMTYPCNVYGGTAKPFRSLPEYGAFSTFFPVMYSGVITDVSENRIPSPDLQKFHAGISRFTCGLAKKVLLADRALEAYLSIQSLYPQNTTFMTTWLGLLFLVFGIYYSLSGYADMACGLASVLGFSLPENFSYPFTAASVTGFIENWHMTLTGWFRKYVADSFTEPGSRELFGIPASCILAGLWYRASLNGILLGVLAAVILVFEKMFFLRILKKIPAWIGRIWTLLFVFAACVLISQNTAADALHYAGMLSGNTAGFINRITFFFLKDHFLLLSACIIGLMPVAKTRLNLFRHRGFDSLMPLVILFILFACTSFIVSGTFPAFAYFGF